MAVGLHPRRAWIRCAPMDAHRARMLHRAGADCDQSVDSRERRRSARPATATAAPAAITGTAAATTSGPTGEPGSAAVRAAVGGPMGAGAGNWFLGPPTVATWTAVDPVRFAGREAVVAAFTGDAALDDAGDAAAAAAAAAVSEAAAEGRATAAACGVVDVNVG